MLVLKLVSLLCLSVIVSCNRKIFDSETGDISSFTNDYDEFVVRVLKGKRIVVSVTRLRLRPRSHLKIRDGHFGTARVYKMEGSNIFETKEGRSSLGKLVELPIRMTTTTRKLVLSLKGVNVGGGDGFSAHYTSYEETGNCFKKDLEDEYENAEITCDTDPLSPVASRCQATLRCGRNYNQYNEEVTCSEEEWSGKIQCYPKSKLVKQCSFDFDKFTTENCRFSNHEVAEYYLDVENAVQPTLGRSNRRVISCNDVCAHDGWGRRIVDCNNRSSKALTFRCLVCRILYKCSKNAVIF